MEPGKMATISRAIPLDSELEATLRRAEASRFASLDTERNLGSVVIGKPHSAFKA